MKLFRLFITSAILIISFVCRSQVSDFPYLCGFETGPDGSKIVGNEPNWDGSSQWEYDDYETNTGKFSAKASITTTGDNSRNLYVTFDCSAKTGVKPSFYYNSTNQNITIQVVGMVDGENWIVLKDWFTPVAGTWTNIDYSSLSNLSNYDDQSSCRFGIRAKKVDGTATLRLDNFRIIVDDSDIWKIEASTEDWNTAANWFGGSVPSASADLVIPSFGTNYPVIGSADANCNNISVRSNAHLTINESYTLNVNGNLTIESDSTGTGSFLNKGSLNMVTRGTICFQRYIEAYSGDEDGWHLISSPVGAFTVGGSDFEPGNNDDLYKWGEEEDMWLNYKANSFDFEAGKGYLVAYESSDTKEFTGSFYKSNITLNNLSVGEGNGWHLLGNPYQCAIKWNDGNWNISNFESTAHVYNESSGNYASLTSDEIIPVTQGFFVKATDASNSITISKDSRTHDDTPFYYPYPFSSPILKLKVYCDDNSFYDETTIRFIESATADYDPEFDGHKLFGQLSAPQLFSLSDDDNILSVNTYGTSSGLAVSTGFEAGVAGTYHFTPTQINGFDPNLVIALEDLFLDSLFILSKDTIYTYQGKPSDDSIRFIIHFFDYTYLDEYNHAGYKIYQDNDQLHIISTLNNEIVDVCIFDLNGRIIHKSSFANETIIPVGVSFSKGCYLINISGKNPFRKKIVIN